MLTNSEKEKLKKILIRIETNKILSDITWLQVESGINNLSDQEKDRIVKSLIGGADGIKEFIQAKLKQSINDQVELSVDTILTQETVPIDYLYRVLT